mmetsp:Transcript_50181/g.92706  ORF Transcript_50181/g.92706 Transcript_50181/m.92706 type:complete len:435 (+) Transcript_50181:91-1395(+)
MSIVEQRLDGFERHLAEHGAVLRRRLDGLERRLQALEQSAATEAIKGLHVEVSTLKESLFTAGVLDPGQSRRASANSGVVHPTGGKLGPRQQPVQQARRQTSPERIPQPSSSSRMGAAQAPRPDSQVVVDLPPTPLTSPHISMLPGIYICGGHASGLTLAGVDHFDPGSGRWEALPTMPTARHGSAAMSIMGVLYVVGGANDNGLPLNSVERLDPLNGSWEQLPGMPTPRHGCAGAAASGVLYVLGGYDSEGVLGVAERFDPTSSRWEVLPPLQTPRGRGVAVAVEGLVYAIGGADDNNPELAEMEVYDPAIGRWQALAPMPTPRCGCAAAVAGSEILVFGGRGGGEKLAACEKFSPSFSTWVSLEPMPTPRDGLSAVTAAGKIYVFGGRGIGQTLSIVECLPLGMHAGEGSRWEQLPPMPKARCGCAAASATF